MGAAAALQGSRASKAPGAAEQASPPACPELGSGGGGALLCWEGGRRMEGRSLLRTHLVTLTHHRTNTNSPLS